MSECEGNERRLWACGRRWTNREAARQARVVCERGAPELVAALDAGRIGVYRAYAVATPLPPDEQMAALAARPAERHGRQFIVALAQLWPGACDLKWRKYRKIRIPRAAYRFVRSKVRHVVALLLEGYLALPESTPDDGPTPGPDIVADDFRRIAALASALADATEREAAKSAQVPPCTLVEGCASEQADKSAQV